MKYYAKLFFRGLQNPQKVYNALRTLIRNSNTDLFIVSYPKTGRTWLRILIAYILYGDRKKMHLETYTDTYSITRPIHCKTTQFTHDGLFNLYNYSSYNNLKFQDKFYREKFVIFLSRDIRDTLVSHYFEESKRMKTYNDPLSDFLKNDVFGARKIVRFYNLWYLNKNKLDNFTHLRYEDLQNQPIQTLRKVIEAMGIQGISDKSIRDAFEFATFNNLKRLEKKGAFKDSKLKPGDKNDAESYKVRKGKIGGFENYLSQKDLEYIDSIVKKDGIQECDWYYWN